MNTIKYKRYKIERLPGNEMFDIWKIEDLKTGEIDFASYPRTMEYTDVEALDEFIQECI